MILKKIGAVIRGICYYTLAHIIISFHYDKAYCRGKYFSGKLDGLCSVGWRWVVNDYFGCKRLHVNKGVRWPVSPRIMITGPENIIFHPDDLNNFQGLGNNFQAIEKIEIGKGTYIAPNVGIITANHKSDNIDLHDKPKPVIIGEKCWIGMNSVILPGVELGRGTIVGAGSVVTKSFKEENYIIAGNPAKMIRKIEKIGHEN